MSNVTSLENALTARVEMKLAESAAQRVKREREQRETAERRAVATAAVLAHIQTLYGVKLEPADVEIVCFFGSNEFVTRIQTPLMKQGWVELPGCFLVGCAEGKRLAPVSSRWCAVHGATSIEGLDFLDACLFAIFGIRDGFTEASLKTLKQDGRFWLERP